MAMKDRSPVLPISWMVQMLGWFRAEADRASRRKRSRLRVFGQGVGEEFQGYEAT
jgi:hypothetical protein